MYGRRCLSDTGGQIVSHGEHAAQVTVVIPTLASATRHDCLLRAIESAKAASRAQVSIIVAVNGSHWNPDTVTAVERCEEVKVVRVESPSSPGAIAYGRRLVETEFFAFLDDDDELLPGGLDIRIEIMRSDAACDLVITNGKRRAQGRDSKMLSNLSSVEANPLRELFVDNWLPSCGALFRTSTIGPAYFDDYHDYAEWTWLAYRLAMDRKRIRALDALTFIVNDTPGSLSKSGKYRASYLGLYERMLNRNPPPDVRKEVQKRVSSALHDMSCDCLDRNELVNASRYHLRSLVSPSGFKYLSHTRNIALAFLFPKQYR
jgi:glycosyltransferase involved in cell wall biosynthesis